MGSTLSSAGPGISALPVQPFSFKWPFSFLRLWPGREELLSRYPKTDSNKINVLQAFLPSRVASLTDSLQRIKWRLSDWFMPAPGWGFLLDQRSKEGCPLLQMRPQTPWNQKVTMHVCVCACVHTHTHTVSLTFHFGEDTVSQRLHLYSSGGSGESQNLLFSERAVCLNIVCVQ